MESLIIKFTIKCMCFYNILNVKGLERKDDYLGGSGREKFINHSKNRTTDGLHMNEIYKCFIQADACAKFYRKFRGQCRLLHHKGSTGIT